MVEAAELTGYSRKMLPIMCQTVGRVISSSETMLPHTTPQECLVLAACNVRTHFPRFALQTSPILRWWCTSNIFPCL